MQRIPWRKMLHRINGPMLHRLFSNLAFVASTHESNTIQRLRGTCKLVACANVKPTKCEHIYLMEIRRTIRLNTYTASSFVVVQIHQTSCCFIIFLRIDEFTWKHHAIIYVLKIRANNYIPLNILEEEERMEKTTYFEESHKTQTSEQPPHCHFRCLRLMLLSHEHSVRSPFEHALVIDQASEAAFIAWM